MAEITIIIGLASKLLSAIDSPSIKKACKRACSIWKARDDLDEIRKTIQTIQLVLLDAEKKQEGSVAVKDWIKRVKDVLYNAEDLFDEVATDDTLRKPIKVRVRVSCSSLNSCVSNYSIAKEVKAIRKSLDGIYKDVATFQFVELQSVSPVSDFREGQDPGDFVDSKTVFGRVKDKSILEMFLDEPDEDEDQGVSVIAVVGMGGMGKTTLAQLVYNDVEVAKKFEKRWFACISDTFDDKKIIGKIFQSMHAGENYDHLTKGHLMSKIKGSVTGKFLLVLDDVWDEDGGKWQDRMSLLRSGGAQGSKIIVTTRSLSVASGVDSRKTHYLDGLSEDESWALFKRTASFTQKQENDPRWTVLGRQIVEKCANVPLAIKSIGGLLCSKSTIQEWRLFKDEELSKLEVRSGDSIMDTLKISYKYLSSNLKHCFAYCSLFPEDYNFDKMTLIYLWNAQGYIKPNSENQTVEDLGYSYFMELLRRSFFQEAQTDVNGDIVSCKMHDLVHDLARQVAGEESIMFTESYNKFHSYARHVSVGHANDDSWKPPAPLLKANRLRSFLYMDKYPCKLALKQHFVRYKFLRALSLKWLPIENLSSSIGELKHLRYLDISHNTLLKDLPSSITKLLNLQQLDLRLCVHLQALPKEFRKLTSLRSLDIEGCESLKHMPPGFGELALLQRLDEFKVGRGTRGGHSSNLDALIGLKLKGTLGINFEDDTCAWDGVDCWKPPVTLEGLRVVDYKGMKIPHWVDVRIDKLMELTLLHLSHCSRVTCLPPLRHLPSLKDLTLSFMEEFEYVEEDEEQGSMVVATSIALVLPCLEKLQFLNLPKLKGWSRTVDATTTTTTSSSSSSAPPRLLSFPSLSTLSIYDCDHLESMPLSSPLLHTMTLHSVNAKVIPQLLSIQDASQSSLGFVSIWSCNELTSFHGESLTSLRRLSICKCNKLKDVELAPLCHNILEHLMITSCPELELWGKNERGVDWDSLPNLLSIFVNEVPISERLPDCLRQRQALGALRISCFHSLKLPPPPQVSLDS